MSTKQIVTRVEVRKLPKRNNQKKTVRRNRKRNNRRKQIAAGNGGAVLANCTLDYARALVNPFRGYGRELCIPDTIVLPSFKFKTITRGVFSTGTMGVGFAVYNPWMGVQFNTGPFGTATNDPVVYTTTAYGSATYSWFISLGVYGPGIQGAQSNSPFPNAFWVGGLTPTDKVNRQFRLVCAGIKVRYIGTDFRNQGRLILYRSQGNQTVQRTVAVTGSNLLQDTYAQSVPVSRKAEYVFYQPDQATNINYQNLFFYDPTGGQITLDNANYSLLIYVDGGDTTTPQSWEFEAVSWYEAIGANLSVTPSHSDPVGFGAVNAAAMSRNPIIPPEQVEKSFLQKVLTNVATSTSHIVMGAASRLPGIAYNYAMGNNAGYSSPMIEDMD